MKLGIGTQHSWITAGLLFALTVTPCNALEIVVPAYFYPTNGGYWNDLNSAASIAPLTAIMNPNSGPGSQQNSDYTSAVGSLRAAGGKVIGYVSSSYANRSLNAVLSDIDKYAMWYDIDGIFIDEMTNNMLPANLDFYESIYEHVKSIDGTWELMGNPGTATAEQYLTRPTADRLMVFESYGANYLSQVPSAWNADYESSRFVNLLHQLDPDDIALMEHYVDTAVSRNVGGVFFTDDVLSNPWDRLPSFWDAMVSKVAAVNSFVPGPQQVLSNSVPHGVLTVDAERSDWNGIVAYDADVDDAPLPGPELDISTVTIANDSSSLYIRLRADEAVNGLAPPLGITHNIYLDVDNDRESGFIGNGGFLAIGAEFLIQGGRLYRFQGASQETFSWKYLEDLIADDSVTSDIELSVSLATLGLPEAFDWLANAANSNMDDYLPNGADGGAFGSFYRYEVGGGFLVGDYDSSGVVDAADYEYWRTHFGEAGGPADGNSDGVVNAADYTVWRDAFISAPGANPAVAVPEPSLLAIVAFIAAFLPRE